MAKNVQRVGIENGRAAFAFEAVKKVKEDKNVKLTEEWPEIFKKGEMSGEQHVPFINALSNNKQVRLILNVENQGIIKGIPEDVVVEIPVVVDKNGLQSQRLDPDLDDRIKEYFLIPRIMRMKMALEAFIKKDIEILKEFLVRDPRTKSFKQVEEVLSEIMNHPINSELKEYFNL